jgi:hypothetical protein
MPVMADQPDGGVPGAPYDPGGPASASSTWDINSLYQPAADTLGYITFGPPSNTSSANPFQDSYTALGVPVVANGQVVAPSAPDVFYDAPESLDVAEAVEDVFFDAFEFLPELLL